MPDSQLIIEFLIDKIQNDFDEFLVQVPV